MIAMAARGPREDEQAAFEVIRAVEDVVSHRWLEEGNGPTPDLEVVLGDGQVVRVEITMSTEGDRRRLYKEFDCQEFPRLELDLIWSVVLSDHSPERRRRRRDVKKLVKRLVPVLGEIESQGGDPAEMVCNARSAVARIAVPDWDGLDVLRCRRLEAGTIGGVRIRVAASYGGPVGSVDELIADVRERIEDKTSKGQLATYSGPKWLVIALDSGLASMQLEHAFGSDEDERWLTEVEAITHPGIDEVWAISNCLAWNVPRVLLRLSGPGGLPAWQSVESHAGMIDSQHGDEDGEQQDGR